MQIGKNEQNKSVVDHELPFRGVLCSALVILAAILCCQNSYAGMYKCLESDGSVRYTDVFESELCVPMKFKDRRNSFNSGNSYISESILARRAAKYEAIIHYYGVRYNIDPHLIRAVIRTESAFDPRAVSKKGAQGLMQLMPETARELRVGNPFDPEENIKGGTKYLRSLLNTFQQDVGLALAAYNAGPTLVKREKRIPRIPETQQYVKKVLKFYRVYKNS